ISSKELKNKQNEPYIINFGSGILEKYFNEFQLKKDDNISTYPSGDYARICIAVKDPFKIYPKHIRLLLEYAKENNKSLKYGVGARLIFVKNSNNSPVYYFMFWAKLD